jgi:GTP-binding protein HflX
VPTVALVGYTNAGKSTLFNAITNAGVLESSRMFATLDPKLSAVQLPSRRKVLLSDTVGFIRDLPHTLVTSFRATLEEVRKAEVLIHVRDASSPMCEEHKAEVEKVLGELDVLAKPRLEVMNKVDLLSDEERASLASANGRAIAASAKEHTGLETLLERLDEELVEDPVLEQRFQIPQSEGDVLAALEAGALIQSREYDGNLVRVIVAGPASLLGRYRRFRVTGREPSAQTKQTG